MAKTPHYINVPLTDVKILLACYELLDEGRGATVTRVKIQERLQMNGGLLSQRIKNKYIIEEIINETRYT